MKENNRLKYFRNWKLRSKNAIKNYHRILKLLGISNKRRRQRSNDFKVIVILQGENVVYVQQTETESAFSTLCRIYGLRQRKMEREKIRDLLFAPIVHWLLGVALTAVRKYFLHDKSLMNISKFKKIKFTKV